MSSGTNQLALDVSERKDFTRASLRQLRNSGRIPGVLYGDGGQAITLHVDEKQLRRVARRGRSELLELKVGEGGNYKALIKEIQQKNGKVLHVDFQRVSRNKPIRIKVPIVYNGTAEGTKVGGVLQIQATELEVEGLPDALPSAFEVDMTPMQVSDKLSAGDIDLPEGVTLVGAEDELLASIVLPRAQEAQATAAEEAEEAEEATS